MSRLIGLPDIPTFTSLHAVVRFPRPVTTGDRLGLFDFDIQYIGGIWKDLSTNLEGDFPFAGAGDEMPGEEIAIVFRAIVMIGGLPRERTAVYKLLPIENVPGAIDLGKAINLPGQFPTTLPDTIYEGPRLILPDVFEASSAAEETVQLAQQVGRVIVAGSIANIGDNNFKVTLHHDGNVSGPLTLQPRTSIDITFLLSYVVLTPEVGTTMRYQAVVI